jgi:hypothetical protein
MSSIKGRLLLVLFVLAFAVPSFGGSIGLDFGDGDIAGGVIDILGANSATGVGIPIATLKVIANGAQTGKFDVTGGCLGYGCLNFDTTGAGTISIVGTVDGISGTLLTGTIASLAVTDLGPAGFFLFVNGPDTKNADLLTALGITLFHPFEYYQSEFTAGDPIPGTSGYISVSADIKNNTVTPEPVSMLLMGTFFSLAGGVLSKKKRA